MVLQWLLPLPLLHRYSMLGLQCSQKRGICFHAWCSEYPKRTKHSYTVIQHYDATLCRHCLYSLHRLKLVLWSLPGLAHDVKGEAPISA